MEADLNEIKKIRDMQPESRPDEKFMKFGPKALSDAELLAVILRTGSNEDHSVALCEKVLSAGGEDDCSILNIFDAELNQLMKIKGIGKVKALQIKSIAELSQRIAKTAAKKKLNFNSPATIADYYMEQLRHRKREAVVLLMLNSAGEFICDMLLFEGTVNQALFSPREIYLEALKHDAVNIILIHNHPSGSTKPSHADCLATKRVSEAGSMIGIELLDHIIIGDGSYLSFREEGLFT